jgi:hypothetical protein
MTVSVLMATGAFCVFHFSSRATAKKGDMGKRSPPKRTNTGLWVLP